MNPTAQPQLTVAQAPDYRETYANSVQVRVSVWDFQLAFGLASSDSPDQVTIKNHAAIYLSPQQAKALHGILQHHIVEYERAFGEIKLDPQQFNPGGAVN